MQGREGDAALVNGLAAPDDRGVAAGTLERWRILNASPSRYYLLALDGHPLHVDRHRRRTVSPLPRRSTSSCSPPASGPRSSSPRPTAGSYALRTRGYDRGSRRDGRRHDGRRWRRRRAPTSRCWPRWSSTGSAHRRPRFPERLAADADLDPGRRRTRTRPIELAMGMGPGGGMGGGMGGGGMMVVHDQRRVVRPGPHRTSTPALGDHRGLGHHQHLDDGPPVPPPRLAVPGGRPVIGPAGPAGLEGHRQRSGRCDGDRSGCPFTDITGRTVYHCHILDHEDQGMMGVIQVR